MVDYCLELSKQLIAKACSWKRSRGEAAPEDVRHAFDQTALSRSRVTFADTKSSATHLEKSPDDCSKSASESRMLSLRENPILYLRTSPTLPSHNPGVAVSRRKEPPAPNQTMQVLLRAILNHPHEAPTISAAHASTHCAHLSPSAAFAPRSGEALLSTQERRDCPPSPSDPSLHQTTKLKKLDSGGSTAVANVFPLPPAHPRATSTPLTPVSSTVERLPADLESMAPDRSIRRRETREGSKPYTAHRQANKDKRKIVDRHSIEGAGIELHSDPVRALSGSGQKLTGDQDVHYPHLEPASIRKTLAAPRSQTRWASNRTSSMFADTGSITSSVSPEPMPVKIEKLNVSEQILNDQRLAERLQAMEDQDPMQGQSSFRVHPSPSGRVLMDDLRKITKVPVSPSRDYRIPPEVLQIMTKRSISPPGDYRVRAEDLSEKTKRSISPSRDYRVTKEDLERFTKSSPIRRNSGFGTSMLQNRIAGDRRGFVQDTTKTKNETNLGVRPLTAGGEAVWCSTPKSRPGTVTNRETLQPAPISLSQGHLLAHGTQANPIDLVSDSEGEDLDAVMLPDCDTAVVVQNPPILMRDCTVCGDSNTIADMPELSQCKHGAETCAGCLASWIKSELGRKGWRGITCPDADCSVVLAHHEVQQYATPEVFTQYDMFAMRDALGEVPNFRWCTNPKCSSGQEHQEDGYIFTCVACGHKVCLTHNVAWHEGETCDEYTYRASGAKEREQKAQEEASIKAINKLSKKCPGPGCAFSIQKNQGCDHMTCSRCRYEFCWECLADFKQIRRTGNAAHKEGCKYHSSRIE